MAQDLAGSVGPPGTSSTSDPIFGGVKLTPQSNAPHILLVDGCGESRVSMRRRLENRYRVTAVDSDASALRTVQECEPDLVLMGVMKGATDSFALLAAVRSHRLHKSIPVILLSVPVDELGRVGFEDRADDFLVAPFSESELISRIQLNLHRAKVHRNTAVELRASVVRFEQLVAMMPAGVLACDATGQIRFFNRRAEEIWRARPEPSDNYESFSARFRMLSPGGLAMKASERHVGRALKEGISFESQEALMERPDGTRFVTHFDVSPTFGSGGAVTGAILVFRDVTAERNAREALQQTEERYRAVFQQAAVGIFECDLRGKIVRSNPALSRIMGLSAEELNTKNWRDLSHPDELAAEQELVGRLLRSEIGSLAIERRFLRSDGTFGWIDLYATLIRDAAGAPSYGLGVVVDISERKRAEAGVRESEVRFREAADNAPVLIWMAGVEKRATWFNRPWLRFVGRSLETECGEGWMGNIHPEDHQRCADIFNSAFDRKEVFSLEYRLRRNDGEYRWLLDHGVPRYQDSEFAGYIGSAIDITDRRAAEEAMNESRNAERARRQELEVLTQIAPAGIWMAKDPECREITGNAAAHAMLRIPMGGNLSRSGASDLSKGTVEMLLDGRPVATEQLAMRVAARTGQTVTNQELEFRFADGTSTWVYGSATPLMDEAGKVRGVICVMVDVTERKFAEAALRLSEKQLRLITDHTAVMLAQLDREHRYRFVNRTYSVRYGRPVEELIGLHVSEVIGVAAYEAAKPHIAKALEGESCQFEIYYPDKGRWGHVVYEPERAADGVIVGLVAVVIDITHRKQGEIELQRARDEALAASRAKDDFLAALSHELRTPLSPVLLLASEAAGDLRIASRVRKDFATIRKCVELEARLIDDLLDLTRITRGKLALDQGKLDLRIVVRDALSTVAADLEAKCIEVGVEISDIAAWVWGDPVRLQQVFWNILKNAVKFTPSTGRVVISGHVDSVAGSVVFEVQDSGIGITPEELERVFEAFSQGDHAVSGGSHRFGGLGLGLAIARRVIELHDGRITAVSAGRNRGATFRVELPLISSVQAGAQATCTSRVVVPKQWADGLKRSATRSGVTVKRDIAPYMGRILLVEDHAPTRLALEQLLIRRNYDVRSAASAAEARALAKRESFILLISDIGLPDGNGYELMKEFRETYGMVGISLTGYGMEDDVLRSQRAGFIQHLTKPVRMQSLDEVLSRIPGSSPAGPA